MKNNLCPNLNHRQKNAQVRACPNCGEVVNTAIPVKQCSQEEHARKKRNLNKYCVDCGEQLID